MNNVFREILREDKLLRKIFPRLRDFVMMGLDFACHNDDSTCGSGVKVNNDGSVVGGVTVLPEVAISLIIDMFFEANRMDLIDSYISGTARKVYGLAPAGPKERYVRDPKPIPVEITGVGPNGTTLHAKPFMRGKMQNWHKVVGS